MTWSTEFAIEILPALLLGLLVTIRITLISMALALVVGLLWSVLRRLSIPVVSGVVGFLVQFIRGTPLLVQAYVVFYVFPQFGISMSPMTTGILVLGLNYSAYTAEVYRSGIEGVPRGQWEACTALGLPASRVWRAIVLPQAIRPTIPVLGNYLIQMFKDSAILSAITVVELMATAQMIGTTNFRYLEPLTIAGLLFLLISYPSSLIIRRLERRYALVH